MEASLLFLKLTLGEKDLNLYRIPKPNTVQEQETGAIELAKYQGDFLAKLEEYFLMNEHFIAKFLKEKRKAELDAAQRKFDFVKDL